MDPNAQMQQTPVQGVPNMGQRNAMPPVTVPGGTIPSSAPQPPIATTITSASMGSMSKEGGPIQLAKDEEDEQQNLPQSLPMANPPGEDEQATVQSYIPQQPEVEDTTKTSAAPLPSIETKSETEQQQVTVATPVSEVKTGAEVLRPSSPEVAVSQELAHLIEVTAQQDRPRLTPDVQKAGVTYTNAAIPVPQNPFGFQTLPMQYQDAVIKEKKSKFSESIKWLAGKVAYFWRKINPEVYK